MKEDSKKFLHSLLGTPSPSGFERKIGRLWRSHLEEIADEVNVDVMGNNVVEIKGTGGPRILLTAHLDEIGLMVTRVGEDGFIRFRASVAPMPKFYQDNPLSSSLMVVKVI